MTVLNKIFCPFCLSHLGVLLVTLAIVKLWLLPLELKLGDIRITFSIFIVVDYGDRVHINVLIAGDVCEVMIKVTVAGLISSDVSYNITDGCISIELIVLASLVHRLDFLPMR